MIQQDQSNEAMEKVEKAKEVVATLGDRFGDRRASATHYDTKGNASHYKDVIPGWQYMEIMQHLVKNMTPAESAALTHTFSYLSRFGEKDDRRQEAIKALWYFKLWAAIVIVGRPVMINEIEDILNGKIKE
jgi:hypothetical protein